MGKTLLSLLSFAFAVCAFAKPEFKFVDISSLAKTPFEHFAEGDFAPVKGLESGSVRDFGGVKFKLGSSALSITSRKTIRIKIPENADKYRYIYILGNAGDKIRAANERRNLASMTMLSKSGAISNAYPKKHKEGGSAFVKSKLENALSVYENGGNLYISVIHVSELRTPLSEIKIEPSGHAVWNIFAITLSDKLVKTGETYLLGGSDWKPVDTDHLEIVEGSALDVSALMTPAPCGKFGRVIVNSSGMFAFADKPDERVKFKGTNMRPADLFGRELKTHADIDKFAKMFRKQGYNMLRWRISMRGSREFDAPYKMKPYILDMYDYLIFALGREGVYSHWNLSSHDLGESDFTWDSRFDLKCRFIFGDPAAREAWRKLMKMQLEHVNPYTGLAWKDDPSIATTEYYNELDTLYPFHSGMTDKGRAFGNSAFQKWARKNYKDIAELNAAWKPAKPFKSFDEIEPFTNLKHRNRKDVSRFIIDASREMQSFCENVIRNEIGLKAPVHQHNCVIRTDVYLLSAEAGSYMANNVYFCHPSRFMSEGSYVSQHSSLTPNASGFYWLHAANKRIAGRPYCVTEYQHSHWNRYKHEAGVFFPAYSAFQNFDNLTIHDKAVWQGHRDYLGCFEAFNSPTYRANEFLSNFLFYRGDVRPSPHRVDVVYDKNYIENSPLMGRGMNHEQSKIAFMTGFGISFPSARKIAELQNVPVPAADLLMEPKGAAREVWGNSSQPTDSEKKDFDISSAARLLRDKSILTSDNITDPSKNLYQSDTKELTVDFNDGWVRVITPKSEAIALKPETKNASLDRLFVKSTSVPASVAAVAVDNKPLSESGRIVFVYNTDNSVAGCELSLDHTVLKNKGHYPVTVLTGKLSAELKLPEQGFFGRIFSPKKYSVYALKLDGSRAEKLPFEISDGVLKIDLDTSKLKEPAVFYEIVAE